MIRRILVFAALALAIASGAHPALADKRIALVVGNAAYQNIAQLDNPRNDATLMATTLQSLGFTLIGNGPQLDLDKAGLDLVVQKFGASLLGAEVGLFYYAGHGVQVRGSNYLIPVGANPTREADVDFQMVDVNLVLRQMEGSGTKLNMLVLDACRNNPFSGTGMRSSSGGLAQMRAPEGTLISFATQPGNTALDGEGNSPYTKALAATIRKKGLDIFQTFNEVGLAVKRSTGGAQQPWVSSSPIDGSFYFVPPAPAAATAPESVDNAAQAWAATRDTNSIAVMDTFIKQYGDSLYGPFARARRDELKNSQAALATPPPPAAKRTAPRLTRDEVVKQFELFNQILAQVRKSYVDKREDKDLMVAANTALQRAFPPPQQVSSAGRPELRSAGASDAVYDTALTIMNEQPSASEDSRIVGVAIKGALASLDPHSNYLSANEYREMQTQTRGTFGGLGIEVSMNSGLLKVVTPFDESPAAKAGILANDVIAAIDDESTQGLTLSQAVAKMRGAVGSKVRLKVIRPKLDQPIEFTMARETIKVRPVRWRIEENDVGYVRITTFNEQTHEALKQALGEIGRQVASDKLKGYIIDLRNNSGGLLTVVTSVADEFLESGEIFSTRGRNPKDTQQFIAKSGDLSNGKRIILLINGGTASGSEIMAGALQDNKRATIVGTRSFGKGSIQTIFPLGGENGALRLTTTRYFTPSGNSIQAKGIIPDIAVVQDEPDDVKKKSAGAGETTPGRNLSGQPVEQAAMQSYVPPDTKDDKALHTALALLHNTQAYPPRR